VRFSRRELALATGGLLALIAAFALGRLGAGDDSPGAETARRLGGEIAAFRTENRGLREQLARRETDEKVDRQAYSQVEQQLAALQAKLIEQQEELAFYRGIVGGGSKGGVRVQDFALTAAAEGVRLRFVLAHAERAERDVRGELQIRVEGTRAGRIVSVDLASLAAKPSSVPRSFGFRYFQDIVADLRTPTDFAPQRVVIRILPATRGIKASVESFPWSVRAS
jgi:hypothetical protein